MSHHKCAQCGIPLTRRGNESPAAYGRRKTCSPECAGQVRVTRHCTVCGDPIPRGNVTSRAYRQRKTCSHSCRMAATRRSRGSQPCTFDGCEKPSFASSMCSEHFHASRDVRRFARKYMAVPVWIPPVNTPCRDDPDAMFPPTDEGAGWDAGPAIAVCGQCPLVSACYLWAAEVEKPQQGVYGGVRFVDGSPAQ